MKVLLLVRACPPSMKDFKDRNIGAVGADGSTPISYTALKKRLTAQLEADKMEDVSAQKHSVTASMTEEMRTLQEQLNGLKETINKFSQESRPGTVPICNYCKSRNFSNFNHRPEMCWRQHPEKCPHKNIREKIIKEKV